jgi:glucan phosphoethanolaminetransferase (alkaline phosphatase superfamily)
MKHPKLRKELFLAIFFSAIYLLLNIFKYHLENILQGIPLDIISWILFLVILMLFVTQIFKIIRRRKKSKGRIKLKFIFYVPGIILLFALLYTFSPFKLDSEKLEGRTVLRGCYDSGTHRSTIRFRENKSFEIKWTAESGDKERYYGNYLQVKDTLFLTYINKTADKFGSIVLNNGQVLKCLDRPPLQNYYVTFYVGTCK